MALTSKLGITDSQLGNLQFSGGALDAETYLVENISESLTFVETPTATRIRPPVVANISESLTLVNTLARSVSFLRNVTQTLTLTGTTQGRIPGTFILNISDRLEFFENLQKVSTWYRNIAHTLTLVEEAKVRLPLIFDLAITESLIINQIATKTSTRQKNISQTLTLSENIVRGARRRRNIFENLSLVERNTPFRAKNAVVNEHLALTETLSRIRIIIANVHETVTFTESLGRGSTLNRNISEVLPLRGGMNKLVRTGNFEFFIHEAEVVKIPKKCFVMLECANTNTAIVLPCPQPGDTQKGLHSQIVKRSMNNVLYTYVRRNDLQQLTYAFVIGRPKALDLQAFIETNISQVLTLTNWKGEIWKVQISNNPLEYLMQALFEFEAERTEVSLEFQGVKILG